MVTHVYEYPQFKDIFYQFYLIILEAILRKTRNLLRHKFGRHSSVKSLASLQSQMSNKRKLQFHALSYLNDFFKEICYDLALLNQDICI